MTKWNLNNFKNNKAFIYKEEIINGKIHIGNLICINTKGKKLFELSDKNMFCNAFEDEDVAFVSNYDHKKAVIDSKGNFLCDFIYDSIYGGSEEGLWEVKRNGKHGAVDITGKEIIPCIYDDGCYFSEGLAAECLNDKWGMIDYFNNTVIPFEYEGICICKNNLINAKKNGKWGLINKNNEIVVDFLYDEIDCWNTRECLVYPALKGDKWGIIDRYNNVIEDFIYDDSQLISDNEDNAGEFIILLKGDKKALYSTKRKEFLTDFIYDFIGYLSEGRFSVCVNNKMGFIDTNGETIVPCIYDIGHGEEYNEGLCAVLKDNKYGMIDLEGNIVIPFKYYRLHNCNEGLILATDFGRNTGYINRKGKTIMPFKKYYFCSDFHCGFAIAQSEKSDNVYIDKTGKILEIKV